MYSLQHTIQEFCLLIQVACKIADKCHVLRLQTEVLAYCFHDTKVI